MSSNTDIPIDPSGGSVIVKMPFVLDVSGLTAELFGQEFELTGTEIDVSGLVGATNFYDGTAVGWLHYLQGEEEDQFDVYVNRDVVENTISDISGALGIVAGSTYEADQTLEERDVLQCAGVFSQADDKWNKYKSLQDFVVSWFAYKILGHPAALAAISNDSTLRTEAKAAYELGIAAMRGAAGSALSVSSLTTRDVADVVANLDGTGPDNGMGPADLRLIVQQLMDQAPARFIGADRGYLLPVPWYGGDEIHIQMNMVNNTFQVSTGSTVKSNEMLDSRGKDQAFKNQVISALTNTINDQSFIFKLHL